MSLSVLQHEIDYWNSTLSYRLIEGVFYYLSPITIPTSLIVIIHNIFIILRYNTHQRHQLTAFLFKTIALCDVFRASVDLVAAVLILAANNYDPHIVLSLMKWYMMVLYPLVACPSINISILAYILLSFLLTRALIDPFRHNLSYTAAHKTKRVLKIVSFIIVLCHISDFTLSILMVKDLDDNKSLLLEHVAMFMEMPLGLSVLWLSCLSVFGAEYQYCPVTITTPSADKVPFWYFIVMVPVYYIGPSLFLVIAGVLQTYYLYKHNPEVEEEEGMITRTVDVDKITTTIFMTTTTFCSCNLLFLIFIVIFEVQVHYTHILHYQHGQWFFVYLGLIFGCVKFVAPLLNCAIFPTILVLRKPDLKALYLRYIRQFGGFLLSSFNIQRFRSTNSDTD